MAAVQAAVVSSGANLCVPLLCVITLHYIACQFSTFTHSNQPAGVGVPLRHVVLTDIDKVANCNSCNTPFLCLITQAALACQVTGMPFIHANIRGAG